MYFFRTSYAECCLLLELYFPAQISQGQALCGTRTLDSFVPESMFASSKSAATCVARIATSGNYDESRGVNLSLIQICRCQEVSYRMSF